MSEGGDSPRIHPTGPAPEFARPPWLSILATLAPMAVLIARIGVTNGTDFRLEFGEAGDLLSLFAAIGMAFLYGGVGHALTRRFSLPAIPALAVSLLVGFGVVGTVLLGLGLVGSLRPLSISAVVAACGVTTLRVVRGWAATVTDSFRSFVLVARPLAVVLLCTALTLLLIALSLAPIRDWDSLMYHLDVPAEWLAQGKLTTTPDQLHSGLIGPIQITYVVFLAAHVPHAAGLLGVVGFVTLVLLSAWIAGRAKFQDAPALAVVLLIASTSVLLVASDARVEIWGMVAVLTVAAAASARAGPASSREALLLGVLGGIATAIKWTNAPIVAVLIIAFLYRTEHRGKLSRLLVSGVASSLVLLLPWLLKNQLLLGNALYPLTGSNAVPEWWQGVGLPGHLDTDSVLGPVREEFNLLDWIFQPRILTLEDSGSFQGLNPVVALGWVPGLALIRDRRAKKIVWALVLGALCHVLAVVLFSSTTNLRYLLPAISAMIVASAIGLAVLASRFRASRMIVWLAVVATLATTALWVGQNIQGGLVGALTGDRVEWNRRGQLDALEALDAALYGDGATMAILLFEARGAGLRASVVQDNTFLNWQRLKAASQPCLGGAASHLVLNRETLDYLQSRRQGVSAFSEEDFREYQERCLTPRGTVGPYQVFRIRQE